MIPPTTHLQRDIHGSRGVSHQHIVVRVSDGDDKIGGVANGCVT